MKTKTFDCVEMKRRAQELLQAEYEARKGEFASWADFINAKAKSTATWRALHGAQADEAQPPTPEA